MQHFFNIFFDNFRTFVTFHYNFSLFVCIFTSKSPSPSGCQEMDQPRFCSQKVLNSLLFTEKPHLFPRISQKSAFVTVSVIPLIIVPQTCRNPLFYRKKCFTRGGKLAIISLYVKGIQGLVRAFLQIGHGRSCRYCVFSLWLTWYVVFFPSG